MSSVGDSIAAPRLVPQLRIGQCLVDTTSREIHAQGVSCPVRVTPKAMAVLLVLVEQAGKVVSRDALMDSVWSGTTPTHDVVTQAITQLRKAFGERRDDPRYIETIAKTGYRLLARVEELTPVAPASDEATPAQSQAEDTSVPIGRMPSVLRRAGMFRRTWTRPMALVAVLILCISMVVFAWHVSRDSTPVTTPALTAPSKPYRLITSTTGFEISPSLSPDGAQVAYASVENQASQGARILVQTADPSQPRPLTDPPEGVWDGAPVWSPNGKEIAFLRRVPDAECRVMVIPANGGDERELAACDASEMPSFDWSPNGASLIFSSSVAMPGSPGLRHLDLATGQWSTLRYGAAHHDVDHFPRYSPDGQWIAFIRGAPLGDLWRVPATGGEPERLTHEYGELRGLSWTPDGKAIVFGRRMDGQTRLFRLQLERWQIRDLGVEDAQYPSIASAAPRMAFVQRKPRFDIHGLPLDAASGPGEPLFASSGRDTLPSVSPDGTQLLFTSDRTGDFGLWWANLERRESLRLIDGIRPRSEHIPAWSRDGRRALVSGIDVQGRSGVFEVQPESGQVRLLDLPVAPGMIMSAIYASRPAQLWMISGDGSRGRRLVLLEREASGWRTLAELEGVSVARMDWSRDRLLFTQAGEDGLWQADSVLSPDSIEQVDARYPARTRQHTWAVDENGQIEYMQHLTDCSISLLHIGRGRSPPDVRCLEPHLRLANNGFSVSARSRVLYLSMATEDGANIALMPLPESSP